MGLLGELMVRTYHESQRKPVYRVAEIAGALAETRVDSVEPRRYT
jgi:hypothetical protein